MQSESCWDHLFGHRSMPISFSGCLAFEGCLDESGYGRMRTNLFPRENFSHRISWLASGNEIPSGMKVLHKCDVRCCINPEHLFIGTQAENVADMMAKGRRGPRPPIFGSANHMAALSEDDVWAIRHVMLQRKLFSQAQIARDYGVSPMTISRIANNASWPEVSLGWPFNEVPHV